MDLGSCYLAGVHYQQEYVRCGKPACKACKGSIGHGPYWYAYTRTGAMLRKTYVGKELPENVQADAKQASPYRAGRENHRRDL